MSRAEAALARHRRKCERREAARAAKRKRDREHAASLRQVKVIVEYDPDTPRCATCLHFSAEPGLCRQHGFNCRPGGLCNTWQHPLGERLEVAREGPTPAAAAAVRERR